MNRTGDFCEDAKLCLGGNLRVIFDVGANIGTLSQMFAQKFYASDVYCFEPVPSTYQALVANVAQLERVKCFDFGFSSNATEYEMFVASDPGLNSIGRGIDYGRGKVTINVETIDVFCRSHGIRCIDLLKTDTEGHDLEVLRGAREMFDGSRIRAVFSEIGFYKKDRGHTYFCDLLRFMDEAGFQIFDLYQVASHYLDNANFPFPDYPWSNALFVRNDIIEALHGPDYARWLATLRLPTRA